MNFEGVIIEESLEDTSVLDDVTILDTKIEETTEHHKTPWVKQWTLHTVEVSSDEAAAIAKKLSRALDHFNSHAWYADYKSKKEHYIIYAEKVFHITDRTSKAQYQAAKEYGIALGIPEYQVDFAPNDEGWER